VAGSQVRFLSRLRNVVVSCSLAFMLAVLPSSVSMGREATDPVYPAPGTYSLPRIQQAPSGWVIEDSVWKPRRLSSFTQGSITLFSFFYGACRDPNGCPAAWSAFESVHQEIEKDPKLHGRVRLVYLSLDPNADTPEMLSFYRPKSTEASPWYFLTTWSNWFLKPILKKVGITISYELDDNGKKTGQIQHFLKVYLIDKKGWIREIYTTGFLDPEVLMNDIRTLLMEEDSGKSKG
jgi:protein SCO1/2